MLCPFCQSAAHRCGSNRNGSQRYRCTSCRRKFTDESTRPTDRRRLSRDKAIFCLRLLLEGSSIRSIERLTQVHRDTIITTMVEAGQQCGHFLGRVTENCRVDDVEVDEIWGFVGCKERTRERLGHGPEVGDAWCFTAIERTTKVLLAFHVAKRTRAEATTFANKLFRATNGRFQLTTDGFSPYRIAIPGVFGDGIDYAQLIKIYSNPPREGEVRYSPGEVVEARPVIMFGNPVEARICTSHAERSNLSIRMAMRRMTRLTNAHSKKWENHEAAFGLWVCFYNFCRPHQTLTERNERKTTPGMEAGLTDHVWTVEELLTRAGGQ